MNGLPISNVSFKDILLMSQSETVVFTNSSASPEWFEVGDASHDAVQFLGVGGASKVAVGEGQPTAGIEVVFAPYIRIEHANTKVWALIGANLSLTVIRGEARLTAFGSPA